MWWFCLHFSLSVLLILGGRSEMIIYNRLWSAFSQFWKFFYYLPMLQTSVAIWTLFLFLLTTSIQMYTYLSDTNTVFHSYLNLLQINLNVYIFHHVTLASSCICSRWDADIWKGKEGNWQLNLLYCVRVGTRWAFLLYNVPSPYLDCISKILVCSTLNCGQNKVCIVSSKIKTVQHSFQIWMKSLESWGGFLFFLNFGGRNQKTSFFLESL